jgi:hypothetical protein
MRTNPGLLLGLFILMAGISIILNAIFHIRIPLFRVTFGLFFVYLGVRVLAGGWWHSSRWGDGPVIMAEERIAPTESTSVYSKYDVVFGKAIVDLTRLPPLTRDLTVEVNSVFGSAQVLLDPRLPFDIESSSAFGRVSLPNNEVVTFGERAYQRPGQDKAGPRLHLKIHVVFGSGDVVEQGGSSLPPNSLSALLGPSH